MKPYEIQRQLERDNDRTTPPASPPPRRKPRTDKPPGDPDQDEYERNDTEEYARRQYLLKQTPLATYLPPSFDTGDSRQDEMFTRFSAAWIANTANGAAVSLNRYFVGDLQLAAAQGQSPTVFETFFETKPLDPGLNLSVLNSRVNLIKKVRQIHRIKGAQFHLEQPPNVPKTAPEHIAALINDAQRELEHDRRTLNTFNRTISELNDKTQKSETVKLLRAVEGEADRKRFPNGPAIYQQIQHLQQSEQAQSIREDNQHIELIQTRNNYQLWCKEKTGNHLAFNNERDPRQEDSNYGLKRNIANFLYSKLHALAETAHASGQGHKIEPQAVRAIPDSEFLRGINWQTQSKTIHPDPQQLQMMRDALITAATVLNSKDETHRHRFLQMGNKINTVSLEELYTSRAMKILWIAGAEAPCKLGIYKATNRKLHNDLHLAFEGTVLERLIHLIKNNFRWFAQLQQLVMINRQLATIHKDLNPHGAASQEQASQSLRSMPRI